MCSLHASAAFRKGSFVCAVNDALQVQVHKGVMVNINLSALALTCFLLFACNMFNSNKQEDKMSQSNVTSPFVVIVFLE